MMPDDLSLQSAIRILPPDEARKIAAGEVVERPASLVREFIDNAIDAKSPLIEVVLEGGGVKKTEVRDFGSGIERSNLALACLPHATSKIRSIDDLNTVKSLGFRGEALAAAAAVSALEIITSTDGREAWRLETGPAAPASPEDTAAHSDFLGSTCIESARRVRGTTVRAKFLFDTIPARKRFLKRDSSEVNLCRSIFIDKALAFPDIAFRFIVDGKLKLFFPIVASRRDRFAAALLNSGESGFLHEIEALGEGFSAGIVLGGPELSRQDRRFQYIFANGRRIFDYSLQQAIEFGLQGWFPNGIHPVCALFIDVDPRLADFNIHPAKREARFTCHAEIHHAITSALKRFVHSNSLGLSVFNLTKDTSKTGGTDELLITRENDGSFNTYQTPLAVWAQNTGGVLEASEKQSPYMADGGAPVPWNGGRQEAGGFPAQTAEDGIGLQFLGYLYSFFILVADGDAFYIVDQHAAHERILYEKFISGPISRQPLLVPIPFTTESAEEDDFLTKKQPELKKLGLIIKKTAGENSWVLEELPLLWRLSDGDTIREVLNLRQAGENIAEHWAATIACHAAIRDGDRLDEASAVRLANEAIKLHNKRCPHGRPIMTIINRADLLRSVKRI
ncbi:MAG: DNA mismatch repair endonuclease MutL [Spirochaetaceae bacterium]|jgi:DNA mismatch repair protein MutL|nr:DNA mismatch repair endonuclease MutL [Spirochaetaceae bacterium]